MDFNLNEYPTGGFFGGGYDGSVRADGLDTAKKQSTGSPLGIYTKFESNGSTSDFQQSRLLRLNRFCLQEISAKLLPKERVNFCLRRRISKDAGVKVLFNPVREKAHYGNLITCGSVWTCPVCSARISEQRRQELKLAMTNWRKQVGSVYLLTLTNPHYCGDNLKQLLEGQKKALKYLWCDRKPKEMLNKLGKEGHIIATEVTYGDNGFHPHYHILLFMRHTVNIDGLRSFLALQWQNCCKKAGLPIPSIEHGVDLQDGTFALDYVSKWGLEDEMTKGHTKKGRKGSLTPFDLLRQSVEMPEYGKLFQVFANAFKGKTQLRWSKGLKARLGVGERSDQELAEETDNEAYFVRELAFEIWTLIAKYKQRGEFLQAIEDDIRNKTSTADDLVMKLARYEVQQMMNEDSS